MTATQMIEAWNNPVMRHAMVIHFPVVLSIIGIPFAVAAAIVWRDGRTLRISALAIYVALAVTAFVARNTGEDAEEAVEGSLSEPGHEELEEHEHHGHNLWLLPAATPIPRKATVIIGLSGSLFVIVKVPKNSPRVLGVNVTKTP